MANPRVMGVSALDPLGVLYPLRVPFAGAWNDSVDLPFRSRAMHVSVAGNIKYTAGGVTLTEAFEVGWHPVQFDRIWLTGTTATLTVWA